MQLTQLLGAYPKEVIFTSGATESNNLAIQGLASANSGERNRVVTTSIEHKSVIEPIKNLAKAGYEIVVLPVNSRGVVDIEAAADVVDSNTLLVSIQAASNEVGTIQPIAQLADIAHKQGAFFHTDAAQAVGKIPVDVNEWDVDLVSLSSHKLYGPKGVGALFIRGGPFSLPIKPLFFGGGQEKKLRPGTLNVPGIVGLGEACRICVEEMAADAVRISALRDELEEAILAKLPDVRINGDFENRLPNNSSLTFPDLDAEALIINLPELAISTGSACTSGAPEPSHVLEAMGLSRKDAYSTIRIGVGRFTTQEEIRKAAKLIVEASAHLYELQAQSDP